MQKIILVVLMLVAINVINAMEFPFKVDSLSPNLSYVLFNEGDYVSSMLVSHGPDGLLLVDNGSVNSFYAILDEFGSERYLKYVILTHWHFDHVRGDSLLDGKVKVISHPLTRDYLASDQELLGMKIKSQPKSVLPSVLISEPTTMLFNGDSICMIPVAGHTAGDLLVYFPKLKILHIGDIVFSDMFAFYDIEHGGNVNKALLTLHYVMENFPEQALIIPSHGRFYSMEDIRSYATMLDEVIEKVESYKTIRMDVEQMKENKILEPWADFAKGFSCEDMIDFVYQSLI